MDIANREELKEKLIHIRRDIHKHPEIRWTEFRTTSLIAKELSSLGYEILLGLDTTTAKGSVTRPSESIIDEHIKRAINQGASEEILKKTDKYSGTIGILDTKKDGPTMAFRFDIDALSNKEETSPSHFPYKEGFNSINEGCVHACGHDGHTAIGLGVAEELIKNKDKLKGKIKLIFQPSEEGGGGAIGIVDKGHLDDVDYFFAVHVCLYHNGEILKSGEIGAGCKDFLDNRRFNVTYKGKAAHPAGDPQNGNNALLGASAACLGIHTIAPHGEGMFRANVGILKGGASRNTVAPNAYFELEVRGENKNIADYGEKRVFDIIKGAATLYNLEYTIESAGSTPSGESHPDAISLIKEAAKTTPWFKNIYDYAEVGGSDDVTEMLNRVHSKNGKGSYIGIGANMSGGVHAANFDFDEEVMLPTVELLIKTVNNILEENYGK